jgi:hypothetical protein
MAPLIIAVLIAGAGYLLVCRFWPYTDCTRCDRGSGKLYDKVLDTHYRHCPRCDGTGRTLRPAVLFMNAVGVGGRKGRIKR